MMKILNLLIVVLITSSLLTAQEEKEMPKLDIPEITIVGKKAITLPFARKGEILTINIYEAPKPDTSILGNKMKSDIFVSSSAQTREMGRSWRAYAEGEAGNFSTLGFYGTAGYSDLTWEASIRGGYATTNGHTKNAEGTRFIIGGDFNTIVYTDNDLLKNFRTTLKSELMRDQFGIFGLSNSTVERTRRKFDIDGKLLSTEFRPVAFDAGIKLSTLTISDNGKDVSSFSPEINAGIAAEIGSINLLTKFSYEASTLNYDLPAESPNLITLSSTGQTKFSENISALLGLKFATGSYSDGGTGRMFSPLAVIKVNAAENLNFSFWWEPEAILASYINNMIEIPYLNRELLLRHDLKVLNFGINTGLSYDVFKVESKINYSESKNSPFISVDTGNGFPYIGYTSTNQLIFDLGGSMKFTDNVNLYLSGVFQKITDKTTDAQMPMVPELMLKARGEVALNIPLKIWLGADFSGERKTDQISDSKFSDYFLLNAGVSSNILKSAILTMDIENILNTKYQWWKGFDAPGTRLKLKVRYNF